MALCVWLCMASNNSQAETYFCEMDEFVFIESDGAYQYEVQNFMMNVTPSKVRFLSEQYLKNTAAVIQEWIGYEEWSAITKNELGYVDGIVKYSDGRLHYSAVFYKEITSFSATCRRDQ